MDTPQIRSIDWIRAIPHMLVVLLGGVTLQILHVFPDVLSNFLAAWLLVVAYRYLVRYTVTRYHVKGLRLLKAQRFGDAVRAFEQSLVFFEEHPNFDRWRSIIFLSPGRYGYKEMALLNLGYVYGQMGEGGRAQQYYEMALELNPRNGTAIAALNLLNAKLEDPELQVAE